jgi:hypothetical protein
MGYLLCLQVIYFILFYFGGGGVLWFCYNLGFQVFWNFWRRKEKKNPSASQPRLTKLYSYRLKWVFWFYENHQSRMHIYPTHACHFFSLKNRDQHYHISDFFNKKTHIWPKFGPWKKSKWQIIKCLFGNSSCQFYFFNQNSKTL